ncbi:hypothetical protein Tco_1059813 [Tanacetum coccineum]
MNLLSMVKKLESKVKIGKARKRARVVLSENEEDDSSKQGRIDEDPNMYFAQDDEVYMPEETHSTIWSSCIWKRSKEARKTILNIWDFNQNFMPMDLEIEKEKKKPAEVELDDEKEDLKGYLDIVPREDVAVDIDSLSTKYPIVDWKTYTLSENFMYYKIIKGDGSSKNYKIMSKMLYDFDRQDIVELYRLVKERYSSSKPEGYDLMLWGDLHTLFEPDEESEIWLNQNEYNLISWSLCDFCRVHILLMQNGIAIHMLTKKKYPLSQEMISKMLSKRLEVVQESTQAYELLKFIRSQVKK